MRFVIFGLTVSSAWGNGHATTWRGLLAALARQGHAVTFYERDVPYYAAHRDLPDPPYCELVLYEEWAWIRARAAEDLRRADVAMVTSYCADGLDAGALVLGSSARVKAFYDIDTPITLAHLAEHGVASGSGARYLTPDLIPRYDLYLSFTGGPALRTIEQRWGARRAVPLYCSVDPAVHRPLPPDPELACALGYLGTYAADRQPALERLLLEPARRRPRERFRVVGPQYPADVAWPANVARRDHLAPAEHAAFYSASRLTLNVTRAAMVRAGWSPSVRLFEAAACGAAILSDTWPGLDSFLAPGREVLAAESTEDALRALDRPAAELRAIGRAARARVLAEHTADVRARELVAACDAARSTAVA